MSRSEDEFLMWEDTRRCPFCEALDFTGDYECCSRLLEVTR